MSNATRWYTTREAVKRAVGIVGADNDALIDSYIETASEHVENVLGRRFIPVTETRLYPWPQYAGNSLVCYLDEDLLAVTTLQSEAQNSSPTTIVAADYFLEPVNDPPYRRIEIDLSSSSAFASGDTTQRSISVAGRWAYSETTATAGTVASGLAASAAATTFVGSNGGLIEVGHTLLIESEAVFVSGRTYAALGSVLVNDAGITADVQDQTITVDASHGIVAGETIKLENEEIYVVSVSTNDLSVLRAQNGTAVAAHADDTAVQINRTFTIVRGVNGTTAATHANATAVSKYVPSSDVQNYTRAKAIHDMKQGQSGWTGQIGGEGSIQVRMDISKMEDDLIESFGLVTL